MAERPERSIPEPRKKELVADWQTLMRTFIRPENDASHQRLIKYMDQILYGLHDFLNKHVGITREISLKELSRRFMDVCINEHPEKTLADVISDIIEDTAPRAVNVASPYFVGHMTSALPFFMVHLKTIVAALNQNVVKLETSKVVSVIEKQVLAKIHRVLFQRSDAFYREHVQSTTSTLGSFVEDGTLANITALWVARNTMLSPRDGFSGVEQDGMAAAFRAHDIDRCVVLVSRLGHYSLRKAGGILGIGNRNIIPVDVDQTNRIDLAKLKDIIRKLSRPEARTRILAVVGIAGTTETGTIDPLTDIADICSEFGIHFHVDAAWGGPTLLSEKYRHLLSGIERADSVTVDGHKQFYMPMSCGMVYFRNPFIMDAIEYRANYINRPGSVDLGIKSLPGSREATSLILDSTLKIMGSRGYALLIDHGIETARAFADEIRRRPDFQLITPPTLNILTYRYCPEKIQIKMERGEIGPGHPTQKRLNEINQSLQRLQREAGKSFVSRTTLRHGDLPGNDIVVLRSVIMNPMTTMQILSEILDEQQAIVERHLLPF